MNTSPVSGENAATTASAAPVTAAAAGTPPSPVMAAQFATARAAGAAMRRAVRLTVVGSTTATSTPAQVTQARPEAVRATATL